jgi:hypothetical protein
MADEPGANPPIPPLAEASSALAPIIYFDIAPVFGFSNGIASITLETLVHSSIDGGIIHAERRIVAHLRMNTFALESLKRAINGLHLAAEPTEGKTAN